MKFLNGMFGRGRKLLTDTRSGSEARINCAYCNKQVNRSEIHFRCTQSTCRQPQINIDEITSRMVNHLPSRTEKDSERETIRKRIGERTVFCPAKSGHRARCPNPDCQRDTPIKLCPHCWFELPSVLRDSKTLTIAGLRGAGKTCFGLALVQALRKEIPRRFGGSLTFNDDNGQKYFLDKIRAIEEEGIPPGATEFGVRVQAPSIQMNVKFRAATRTQKKSSGLLGRSKPQRRKEISAASFVFQDPAGEWFGRYERALEINFMRNTDSVILLVDPNQLDGYLKQRGKKRMTIDPTGRPIPPPEQALKTIIANMQGFAEYDDDGMSEDVLIDKDVAVVVTKADDRVFTQEPTPDQIALQRRPYSEGITESVSNIVRNALMREDMLNEPEIVTLAENHFANVSFFAVSALGDSVLDDGNVRPGAWSPKRVEDPFLWIMHQWGLV